MSILVDVIISHFEKNGYHICKEHPYIKDFSQKIVKSVEEVAEEIGEELKTRLIADVR